MWLRLFNLNHKAQYDTTSIDENGGSYFGFPAKRPPAAAEPPATQQPISPVPNPMVQNDRQGSGDIMFVEKVLEEPLALTRD